MSPSLSMLPDTELVALLKLGDSGAYAEIYDRYIFVLLNHAYNKTRNREEAKDIVQGIFTTLWAKKENLHITSNLSGFLYTSMRNIILNQIAHKEVESKYLNSILNFPNESQMITDYRVRENQLSAIIEKEIAELPLKMREVFNLSRRDYLAHKDIAERLHISEQTVSKHITNALKILRVKLGIFIYLVSFIHLK